MSKVKVFSGKLGIDEAQALFERITPYCLKSTPTIKINKGTTTLWLEGGTTLEHNAVYTFIEGYLHGKNVQKLFQGGM